MPVPGVDCTEDQKKQFKKVMQLREPWLSINHTGFGVKIKDLITLGVMCFVGGGAWYAVDGQLDHLSEKLAVVPAEVQADVQNMQRSISTEIRSMASKLETIRIESDGDIKDLSRRVSEGEADRAKLGQQVDNLESLMRDIRDLMRGTANMGDEQ